MALEQSLAQLSLATVSSQKVKRLYQPNLWFSNQNRQNCHPSSCFRFALHETATPSNLIAKAAGVKEPRLARDDLVQEFFKTSTKEVSIANLSKELKVKLKSSLMTMS